MCERKEELEQKQRELRMKAGVSQSSQEPWESMETTRLSKMSGFLFCSGDLLPRACTW